MASTNQPTDLSQIIADLQASAQALSDYELTNQVEHLRSTYTTMLSYLVRGVNDPNSATLYQQLRQQAFTLNIKADRLARLQSKPNEKYAITLKYIRQDINFSTLFHTLADNPNDYAAINNLFEYIWTMDIWAKSEHEAAEQFITSTDIDINIKAVFISAVTLAVLEFFDERKFMLLCDAYLQNSPIVSLRALTGLILCVRHHENDIRHFTEAKARISLLLDDPVFQSDVYKVMLQLQYARLTDSITSAMRNDIIPTILRSTKFKKTNFGIQEIDTYLTQNGENPEWHHNAIDEKAESKIREMSEMQMEGADVFFSTFSQTKKSAFFSQMSNWFLPFDESHPEVVKIKNNISTDNKAIFNAIINISPFCDSDKYSFFFIFDMIGKNGQDVISQSIASQMDSDDDFDSKLSSINSRKRKASDILRSYVYDLYRFYKLSPYHNQFTDIFEQSLPAFSPIHSQLLSPLCEHREKLLNHGEFLMRKKLYAEALLHFQHLQPQETDNDAHIWQKMGFCEQKLGNAEKALRHYSTAYQLNADSQWTLKHLAQTSFNLGKYQQADIYYDILLENDSENMRYLRRRIDSLIQLKKYDDAIQLLYKANYLEDDNQELLDQLAFTQLIAGNTQKARDIYLNQINKLNDLQPTVNIHTACMFLVENDIQQAYKHLRTAWKKLLAENKDKANHTFKQQLVDCAHILKTLGIPTSNIQMLYDAVRLEVEE